jgi:hypothetical protein
VRAVIKELHILILGDSAADCGAAPVPVVRLQGHCAPTVAVAWAFDERRLASSDCDGTVIVWKREHAVEEKNEDPY